MKIKTLEEILKKKSSKTEFAILTNLENGDSEIYLPGTSPKGEFSKYAVEIENFFKSKKNGVIENSEIFVETYIKPIKVIIVGAVHIAQYLVDFAKSLNFEISMKSFFQTNPKSAEKLYTKVVDYALENKER